MVVVVSLFASISTVHRDFDSLRRRRRARDNNSHLRVISNCRSSWKTRNEAAVVAAAKTHSPKDVASRKRPDRMMSRGSTWCWFSSAAIPHIYTSYDDDKTKDE